MTRASGAFFLRRRTTIVPLIPPLSALAGADELLKAALANVPAVDTTAGHPLNA